MTKYRTGDLMLGDQAPDVVFLDQAGRETRLRRWLGRPVLLVFLRWLG